MAARHILGHFLPGAIFGALAEALPDQVIAEGAANIWNLQFTGHALTGEPFTYVWFSCGGTGARPTKDGLHATAFPSGISGVPVEVIEQITPIVLRKRELRADSAGPGKYRGGCGQAMQVAVRPLTNLFGSPHSSTDSITPRPCMPEAATVLTPKSRSRMVSDIPRRGLASCQPIPNHVESAGRRRLLRSARTRS